MQRITSIREFRDCTGDDQATDAEKRLIQACKLGMSCDFGPLPETADPKVTIRADLLRHLITGGTPDCGLHPSGVSLNGAWITGNLDLSFVRAHGATRLTSCNFVSIPNFSLASFRSLSLAESHLPGLRAAYINVATELVMKNLNVTGTINLMGAKIGGNLSFTGSKFGSKPEEDGKRTLAVNAQGISVKGGLFWRNVSLQDGFMNLTTASVGDLSDTLGSWPDGINQYDLDGFRYDRITDAKLNIQHRLAWLAKGSSTKGVFTPQPYTQLAKVLAAAGDDRAARKVLIEREVPLAKQARDDRWVPRTGKVWHDFIRLAKAGPCNVFAWILDAVLRFGAGYGYAPGRSVIALLALIAAAWLLAGQTWNEGSFAPNSDYVILSPGWTDLTKADCITPDDATLQPDPETCTQNPAALWSAKDAIGMDWESFNPFAYAADLVIPVLDLGQTSAWAPSNARGDWGYTLWWLRWLLVALGWLVSALGAAAVTGIIKKDRG